MAERALLAIPRDLGHAGICEPVERICLLERPHPDCDRDVLRKDSTNRAQILGAHPLLHAGVGGLSLQTRLQAGPGF